jgi:hypothetical protein
MKKRYIALSALLIIVGLALCFVSLSMVGFDFIKMFNDNSEEKTYEIKSDITSIDIRDLTNDIEIRKSPDGVSKIVYFDNNRYICAISEDNGKLSIKSDYQGKWYNHISVFSSDKDIVLYLGKDMYDSLYVDSDTSDVKSVEGVSFNSINISLDTGDVDLALIDGKEINVSTDTGDISIKSSAIEGGVTLEADTGGMDLFRLNCNALKIDVDTGDVELHDVKCTRGIKVETSTGDVDIEDCRGHEIDIKTTTGDIEGYFMDVNWTFVTKTSSGRVIVPKNTEGYICKLTTSSGDIEIRIDVVDG